MNTTVILDAIDLPESGPAEIQIERSFTIGISATQARRKVNGWLRDEVSMSFVAESPSLVLGTQIVWRVPIAYTASHVGRVGTAGSIDVDIATGALLDAESSCHSLFTAARPMAAALPPFQLREVPDEYLVADLQPTHDAPVFTTLAAASDNHD